jgi:hypothetical protein
MGNSEAVAREHYLQVTDAHFEAANGSALRYAVQQPSEIGGNAPQLPTDTTERTYCASNSTPPAGLEPAA